MIKTALTALFVAGTLQSTAQAQTAPSSTPAKPVSPTSKTGQRNSGNTAGVSNATTSNNPVDATGKPVGTTESNTTSTVKAQNPKK